MDCDIFFCQEFKLNKHKLFNLTQYVYMQKSCKIISSIETQEMKRLLQRLLDWKYKAESLIQSNDKNLEEQKNIFQLYKKRSESVLLQHKNLINDLQIKLINFEKTKERLIKSENTINDKNIIIQNIKQQLDEKEDIIRIIDSKNIIYEDRINKLTLELDILKNSLLDIKQENIKLRDENLDLKKYTHFESKCNMLEFENNKLKEKHNQLELTFRDEIKEMMNMELSDHEKKNKKHNEDLILLKTLFIKYLDLSDNQSLIVIANMLGFTDDEKYKYCNSFW